MTEYDNTNSGVLFKNDKKETDKHPDYTGKVNVAGKELRLAAWLRDGRKGKFMSLKVSEFQQEGGSKPAQQAVPSNGFYEDESDIPF
jgi:hypothetical protein